MARLVIRVNRAKVKGNLRDHLVRIAKREHGKVLAAEPKPTSFVRVVDGVQGALEDAVREGGRITYFYERVDQIVQFAMDTLIELSPVRSGEYRRSHMLVVNGHPVANLKGFKPTDDISITNPLPYSRKIEVGKMKMRVAGTDRVYQQARRKIMARYGNQVSVEFTYRALIGGRQVDQAKTGTSRFRHHNRKATGEFEKTLAPGAHNKSDARFPALVFHPAGTATSRPRRRQ